MTQEDKHLLLQDLCTRLPYGVIVQQSPQYMKEHIAYGTADKWQKEPHDFNIVGVQGRNTLVTDKHIEERTYAKGIVSTPVTICIYNGLTKQIARPYLRPMSSMTEEEFKELATATELQYDQLELMDWGNDKTLEFYLSEVPQYCVIKVFDWLNAHHFDYRGLIQMGLALEAPEGMYDTKTE